MEPGYEQPPRIAGPDRQYLAAKRFFIVAGVLLLVAAIALFVVVFRVLLFTDQTIKDLGGK